jgi:hypothetical protein
MHLKYISKLPPIILSQRLIGPPSWKFRLMHNASHLLKCSQRGSNLITRRHVRNRLTGINKGSRDIPRPINPQYHQPAFTCVPEIVRQVSRNEAGIHRSKLRQFSINTSLGPSLQDRDLFCAIVRMKRRGAVGRKDRGAGCEWCGIGNSLAHHQSRFYPVSAGKRLNCAVLDYHSFRHRISFHEAVAAVPFDQSPGEDQHLCR